MVSHAGAWEPVNVARYSSFVIRKKQKDRRSYVTIGDFVFFAFIEQRITNNVSSWQINVIRYNHKKTNPRNMKVARHLY